MNTIKKPRPIDAVFGVIQKHPYLCVILACAFLLPFGLCQIEYMRDAEIVLEAVVWIVGVTALIYLGKPSSKRKVNRSRLYCLMISARFLG